ncbi:MAG: hypothetical protein LBB55_03560 [Zoogloeaceae bacterium]|jgi:hypothetical protein|nr:hypothetical protein [Zoogloeaceae bacterium]
MRSGCFCLAWLFCLFGGLASAQQSLGLDLNVGRIHHPLFEISDLRLNLQGKGGTLLMEHLELFGQSWRQVQIDCARLQLESGNFRCEQGFLRFAGQPPVALELRQEKGGWSLSLAPAADERWQAIYGDDGKLRLAFDKVRLALLFAFFPRLAEAAKAWHPAGRISGTAEYGKGKLRAALEVEEGGYASTDGGQAAEKLALSLTLDGQERQEAWRLQGKLTWRGGDLYSNPVFIRADGQSLSFDGELGAAGWKLHAGSLDLPRAGTLNANGYGTWQELTALDVSTPALALQPLGESLLTPFLASQGKPGMELSGQLGYRMQWRDNALKNLRLTLDDGGIRMEGGRFALEGVNGHFDWQDTAATENELSVGRLAIGRLESGAFRLPITLWPQKSFALSAPVTIPLLDGELILRHLAAGLLPDGEWEGALGISLTPVSLEKLTAVLDLPSMAGALSADLPVIRYANREAALDGALIIRVFDGYLNCKDLHFVDPFGVRPRILADVEARHIDLEQLTQTFSFGQVTGFVDADLAGLEIAAWRPLAFDARIASSPGSYPRRISQRAVDNLTSLGSGGAVAALQASFLRFFADFGYRRIGLACRLENGVCHMRGIAGADQGEHYVIVEGGGIPALTVMGHNRQINWEELLARLKAAIGASAPVIQ